MGPEPGQRATAGDPAGFILLVEDDPQFAEDLLQLWSPPRRVRWAKTGLEAFELLHTEKPALVLLDLNLPAFLADVDAEEGLHLLDHIRNGLGWDVAIVIVTRDASPATVRRAMALGAAAVLRKPIAMEELEHVVAEALR